MDVVSFGLPSLRRARAEARHAAQPNDEEYTKKIKEYLNDPRFTTELVDHLPASATVPTPLKFLGTMPGQPGELYYAEDINRYYEELAKVSPRAKFWKMPLKTEEGRDMVVLAIADEETIKNLDKYKADLAALGDPRKTTEAQAQQIIHTAKPIYWITSGIHSPETGGPEMLIELAYRLIVEETPLHPEHPQQRHRLHHAGGRSRRPRQAGRHLLLRQEDRQAEAAADVLGQVRRARQQPRRHGPVPEADPEHHRRRARVAPHRPARSARGAVATSTSPPAPAPTTPRSIPIAVDEWWLLAETEVMEMAKRGVPGVWTYGFYDGWVPNYLFWIAETPQLLRPLLRGAELRPRRPEEPDSCRPPPPAASGIAPTRRCPPSSGARATTPTSRNRPSCSRSTRSRRTTSSTSRTTG